MACNTMHEATYSQSILPDGQNKSYTVQRMMARFVQYIVCHRYSTSKTLSNEWQPSTDNPALLIHLSDTWNITNPEKRVRILTEFLGIECISVPTEELFTGPTTVVKPIKNHSNLFEC